MRGYRPDRLLPPLEVDVRYGRKDVSGLLGESEYAPDNVPDLFRQRIVSEFAALGLFEDVRESIGTAPVRAGAYRLSLVLEPMMKLTKESELVGVGTAGLFALLGGELTTRFELTLRSALRRDAGREFARDGYALSGMTTSTLYEEQRNIGRSWQTALEFALPHLFNFAVSEIDRVVAKPRAVEARGEPRSGSGGSVLPPPRIPARVVPVDTERPAPESVQPERRLVRDIQRHLSLQGYAPGPVDGLMGSRTRQAIRRFQSDSELEADGVPSVALLNRLRGLPSPTANAQPTERRAAPRSQAPEPVRQLPKTDPLLDDLEALDDF